MVSRRMEKEEALGRLRLGLVVLLQTMQDLIGKADIPTGLIRLNITSQLIEC